MKPEFHEDFVSDEADPLAEPYCDFDWNELYACLGEATDEQTRDQVAFALRPIFQWLLNIDLNNKQAAQFIGRRAIAFGWVMNPELFEGKSLTALATALGLDKQSLSKLSAAVTEQFGIQNRGQAHGWNRRPKASQHASSRATAQQSRADQVNTATPTHQCVIEDFCSSKPLNANELSCTEVNPKDTEYV